MPLFRRRGGKKKQEKAGAAPARKPLKEILSQAPPVMTEAPGVQSLVEDIRFREPEPGFKVIETYPLQDPWARARIVQNPETGETWYIVDEIPMSKEEREIYRKLIDILYWELEPPKDVDTKRLHEYFTKAAKDVMRRYRIKFSESIDPSISWEKIEYYVIRDMLGYGKIDPLMRDPNIEDISCDGVGKHIYVWHRKYESIPTNIIFDKESELDALIAKLAHKAGKHVSVAFPIVDAILPEGHRLAATYKREVSMAGSSFTIRKFREQPLSVIDLIKGGTISEDVAAYFWLAMEFKMTGLIMGVTGAGKTTLLNALSTLFRPTIKVVTIEDTPELKLPLENWVQLVARPSYGIGPERIGEITLFDLVKVSLRYRPDVIIVGEVRGEEAYVLFQAIASVSWDTPILIRDEKGNVRLARIGEFVDKFYKDDKEERIAKPVRGYWVLSHDGYRAVWKPIKYVLRHRTNEVYRVSFEGGGELKATGSHSVFVLNPETLDIEEKNVSELRPGDLLVAFVGSVTDGENAERLTEQSAALETLHTPASNGSSMHQAVRASEGWLLQVAVAGDVMNAVIGRLDEDLAFVMGLYLADGCVKHHRGARICITLGSGERDLAEKMVKVMQDKFAIRPTVTDRGTYAIYEFSRTRLAEAFKRLMGGRLEEKRVPSILWNAPKSIVRAFFEGLKADSRRTLGRRYVNYSTVNERLAVELVWLARLHGWYASLHMEKGSGKNEGKIFYNVNVYFDGSYRMPNASERIPTKAILKLIELAKPRSMPLELAYIKRRKFISVKVAEKVLEWVKRKGRLEGEALELYRKIIAYMRGQLRAVEVREVKVEKYDGFVYDISVPETESFFGGNVPILLHNTGHGGLTTLHAEHIDAAVKRLTSPPMNIPQSYIPLINFAAAIKRVRLYNPDGTYRIARKVTEIWEVREYGDYQLIARWDPADRKHYVYFEDSIVLKSIADQLGRDFDWVLDEASRRALVLKWMAVKGITRVDDVYRKISEYYARPNEVYERAVRELSTEESFR